MDDDNGDVVAPLKLAQRGKDRGHILCAVLIGAVKPDKGIEQEQPRSVAT
jgi:hypothetical protein